MSIAIAPSPPKPAAQPLPAWVRAPEPDLSWSNSPLVEILGWPRSGGHIDVSRPYATPPPGDTGATFRFAGRDFRDALVAGAQDTRSHKGAAQALLQAQDGSFYLTFLSHKLVGSATPPFTRHTERLYDSVDGHYRQSFSDVVALGINDAVKAVIGEGVYWDLRKVRDPGDPPAGTAPIPIPATPPPDTSAMPKQVGTIRYQPPNFKVERRTPAHPVASPTVPKAPTWQWAGRHFEGAVGEALARARAGGGAAQAVVEGADGSLFLANLGHQKQVGLLEGHGFAYFDQAWLRDNNLTGATAWVDDPRVKAIVGSDSWMDLRT